MTFWEKAADRFLRRLMTDRALEVTWMDGRTTLYGSGEPVRVAFHDVDLPRRLVMNPHLAIPEAYMDGTFTIEGDDLRLFFAAIIPGTARADEIPTLRRVQEIARARKRLEQINTPLRARRNVKVHYDLPPELYDLFLGEDRQYSCAYFERPDMSLEEAQEAKKRLIAKKLLIEPGMRVLDIGCGWGGMALTLARDFGAEVVGVTLSDEQHAAARKRVASAGLEGRIDIRLQDYRDVGGPFDRIVSVGMFEHVGVPNYRTYFGKIKELLTEDGVALIHTIGRTGPPGITSPFISKYVFPGGYVPALTEVMQPVERLHLELCDLEVWRLHYAETLRHWYERFMEREAEAERLMDARFVRMWRFYLAGSEMTFRHHRQVVFQLQIAKRKDAVPITRDYLYEAP